MRASVTGMSPTSYGVGGRWRPHGAAVFRTDDKGRLIGVLPARCHRGEHVLSEAGYTSREVLEGQNSSGPYVQIACTQCGVDRVADYTWNLTTGGRRPDAVEFDDAPYVGLFAQGRHSAR